MQEKIKIGVSSCLLGFEVRHDGSHKRDRYITDTLGEYFHYIPFCPETAIGLGTPRPAIRLLRKDSDIHLVESREQNVDHTAKMKTVSSTYCRQVGDLSGYILKNKSPSCGMERVNVYDEKGMPQKEGVGLFAAELLANQPNLPVEEEGRLRDARVRENFIERVFCYHRWQKMLAEGLSKHALMEFHRQHKYILLAHNEKLYRKIGKLVADVTKKNLKDTADDYLHMFMQAMKKKTTPKTHVNVLQHSMGYLKKHLDSEDKTELLEIFSRYAKGELPLIVPLTLLNHHFRKYPQQYIQQQFYMNPYPEELMLRNHV